MLCLTAVRLTRWPLTITSEAKSSSTTFRSPLLKPRSIQRRTSVLTCSTFVPAARCAGVAAHRDWNPPEQTTATTPIQNSNRFCHIGLPPQIDGLIAKIDFILTKRDRIHFSATLFARHSPEPDLLTLRRPLRSPAP